MSAALSGHEPSPPDAGAPAMPEIARARLDRPALTGAFERRASTHWFARRPEPVDDAEARFAELLAMPRTGKTVAYLHIPFCANHCLFCGFYRHSARGDFSARYTASLVADLALHADRPAIASGPVHAVYLGGGTPTALTARDLFTLIQAVRCHLPLAPDCEITVEGRIHGFDDEKVIACLDAGANRFSIGVQSFDTALRQRLGRKADRARAERFMADLVAHDRAAVVCDLIYGLPGQTLETWLDDVQTVADLGLDGVDLYALTRIPDSPLDKSIAKGALPPAADLGQQAERYAAGRALLDASGWRQLSQAHWARTPRERNLYNHLIKAQATGLAFGAGAGGGLAGHRYAVEADVDAYAAAIAQGTKPLSFLFRPMAGADWRGAIAATLETGRIAPARIARLAGPDRGERLTAALAPLLDHWQAARLIAPAPGGYALTAAGWFWQTNLIAGLQQIMVGLDDRPDAAPSTQETRSHG
ncbi:heme anaerobic degradation radical SAM methyltransferase ChuW/HutW [Rhodothalassium salexigens]|uniref:heme anaerobic degradation radical SAM methyltransferase ChuW/HutW n=1 Tax=Rhodothalassium salexigens TaxID=1086 RepID=UPI00191299BA|nr:heme anaerobic degradation radical SAM methyltransferase ChuW/HutW [Rhodothalassium salexigens]